MGSSGLTLAWPGVLSAWNPVALTNPHRRAQQAPLLTPGLLAGENWHGDLRNTGWILPCRGLRAGAVAPLGPRISPLALLVGLEILQVEH